MHVCVCARVCVPVCARVYGVEACVCGCERVSVMKAAPPVRTLLLSQIKLARILAQRHTYTDSGKLSDPIFYIIFIKQEVCCWGWVLGFVGPKYGPRSGGNWGKCDAMSGVFFLTKSLDCSSI